LSALSVSTREPLIFPAETGTKLIDSSQEAPAANVPAEDAPALTCGHADAALSFKVKPGKSSGLLPLANEGKVRSPLPMFATVTVCGLSVLVAPKAVVAKLRPGGSAEFTFHTFPSLDSES
jgi:hypothetical protein